MIIFTYSKLYINNFDHFVYERLPWDINAHFRIEIDHDTFFEEPDYPILEIAQQLLAWLRSDPDGRPDYYSSSLETDEVGWVVFRSVDSWRDHTSEPDLSNRFWADNYTKWSIESKNQLFRPKISFSFDQICTAVISFIRKLIDEVFWRFGVDIKPLLI